MEKNASLPWPDNFVLWGPVRAFCVRSTERFKATFSSAERCDQSLYDAVVEAMDLNEYPEPEIRVGR